MYYLHLYNITINFYKKEFFKNDFRLTFDLILHLVHMNVRMRIRMSGPSLTDTIHLKR